MSMKNPIKTYKLLYNVFIYECATCHEVGDSIPKWYHFWFEYIRQLIGCGRVKL